MQKDKDMEKPVRRGGGIPLPSVPAVNSASNSLKAGLQTAQTGGRQDLAVLSRELTSLRPGLAREFQDEGGAVAEAVAVGVQ